MSGTSVNPALLTLTVEISVDLKAPRHPVVSVGFLGNVDNER